METKALKIALLQRLDDEISNARRLSAEFDVPEERVIALLEELEGIEVVERIGEMPGGDRGERLYLSQMRRREAEWNSLPQAQRERISGLIGDLIETEVRLAVEEKTFDARPDRHLSRAAFDIDEQGWREMHAIHDIALDAIEGVARRSGERLRQGGTRFEGRSLQALFEVTPTRDPKI